VCRAQAASSTPPAAVRCVLYVFVRCAVHSPLSPLSGMTSQRNGGTSWDRLAPASDNPARYDRQGDSLQTLEWQEPEASAEEDAEREE
jgi:hypothetical protein